MGGAVELALRGGTHDLGGLPAPDAAAALGRPAEQIDGGCLAAPRGEPLIIPGESTTMAPSIIARARCAAPC